MILKLSIRINNQLLTVILMKLCKKLTMKPNLNIYTFILE